MVRTSPRLPLMALAAVLAAPLAASAQADPNDPATCSTLWEAIGLPDYARDGERDTTVVCHTRYVLSHNNEAKTPDWVLERLTKEQITGTNKRPKNLKFKPDPAVSPEKSAADADYVKSKFDRGHQAPSADFKHDPDWMAESFLLSNVVPQVGVGFNRGIWKNLEDNVRELVQTNRSEIYVITGPIYREEIGAKLTISATANRCGQAIAIEPPKKETICGAKASCDDGVTVPAALFKILYDPRLKRANAFILPNINHRDAADFSDPVEYLKKFRTTVQVVEKYTGLEFFRKLTTRERRPVNEQCAAMMLH